MISNGTTSVCIGMLPEMKTTEPYSPSARAKASAKPVSSAGTSAGAITRREGLQAAGAERRRGLFEFRIQILEHRLHGAHDERQADESQRDHDAERRVGDLDAQRRQPAARSIRWSHKSRSA